MANQDPFAEQTPADVRQARLEEAWHREQKRRQYDTLRVLNDSNSDYYIEWEGHKHRVPAKGPKDLDRYLAEKYLREMAIKEINEMGERIGQEMLKKLSKTNPEILFDKYIENKQVWDKVPKTNDEKLIGEIYDRLYLGIVEEFGMDEAPQDPRSGEVDLKSLEQKTLEKLASRRVVNESTEALESPNMSKEEFEKAVTE